MTRCFWWFALPLILFAATSMADFESAAEAYRNKNYHAAKESFEALAQDGDPRAQTVLAMMHKFGEATEVDPIKAFQWYLRAARAGYAPAQYNVGLMYAEGAGIEQDENAAVNWLKKAAEAGYERANELLVSLDAEVVENSPAIDPDIPWSQSWNFRLPNELRYQQAEGEPLPVGQSFRVQLGAMQTQVAANRLWQTLATRHPDLFSGLSPLIHRSMERAVYRIQTGPFENYRAARKFCDALLGRGAKTGCLPLQ
jgi:TPR repeat protein